jgi:hypothetical protein
MGSVSVIVTDAKLAGETGSSRSRSPRAGVGGGIRDFHRRGQSVVLASLKPDSRATGSERPP